MNKKAKFLVLFGLLISMIPAGMHSVVEGQVVSGANSEVLHEDTMNQNSTDTVDNKLESESALLFTLVDGKIYKNIQGTLRPLEFAEGVWDMESNVIYYTEKDPNSWGSKEYILGYSLNTHKVVKKIKFDNSGYYKYPISISPDSKKLIIAESAQSVGEVFLASIDIESGIEEPLRDKVHSPKVHWINSTEYSYTLVNQMCSEAGCVQGNNELRSMNVETREISILEQDDLTPLDESLIY